MKMIVKRDNLEKRRIGKRANLGKRRIGKRNNLEKRRIVKRDNLEKRRIGRRVNLGFTLMDDFESRLCAQTQERMLDLGQEKTCFRQ